MTIRPKSRYAVVADLLRSGHVTPELEAEYGLLDAERRANTPKLMPCKSIFDLPVARRMWESDAREMER
jgi:hypothetical protein